MHMKTSESFYSQLGNISFCLSHIVHVHNASQGDSIVLLFYTKPKNVDEYNASYKENEMVMLDTNYSHATSTYVFS